jgi:hypothetical protein
MTMNHISKDKKPIKKIVADFYNKLVDGSFNKTYSKFYDTLPFGASDLIIKFLTQGEEPSSSERYPLEQSLLTYPKMVQLILNFYESTTILSKVGENDLIASIMYLYNSGEKNPNALKIFKERLPDHPLGHLLSNDLKSFESSLLNNPKILTESRPKVKLLIDLLYKREKTTEWEIVIKVLQHVDEWTKQDLLNFANIVQTAVEYNDFTTIEALLSIKAFKEQPELLARKKKVFFLRLSKTFQ